MMVSMIFESTASHMPLRVLTSVYSNFVTLI